MTKRLSALLLTLVLICGLSFAAAETFASYQLPQGARVCYVTEAGELEAPQGLESMYALMSTAAARTDVYLMRMPHGRALVSVSCSPVAASRTAEELLTLWPRIAANIGKEVAYVDDDASCAAVENRFGHDLLHIQTRLTTSGEETAYLRAEGFAFCRDKELLEVWAVWPEEPVYLYSDQAAQELEEDLEALDAFLQSLSFDKNRVAIESENYADPDGRFVMQVLMDSVIITGDTPMEDVSAVRERFVAANEEGAANVFDQLMRDVYEQRVTLILTADMKGAIQVFCSREENFAGATPDMLQTLAEPIRESLTDRYGIAISLGVNEHVSISQRDHAFLGYWLRCGECDVQLDALACVIGEDWLCEVDIHVVDGDQTLRSMLHSLVAQTLCYLVE